MEITVNMNILLIFMLTVTCTLSVIAVTCGIMALIKVIAMEKSTHTMQYVSTEEQLPNFTRQENTAKWDLDSNGEPEWATTSASIAEQNKKYQEELKEQGFDFFLPEDDDKKKYSF